ncbi:MAG: hypothetical protein GQ467_00260, partial [Mariprofundaceae bacterium]|nr:hypothetical protein [Mariprofundaceae bacterium]
MKKIPTIFLFSLLLLSATGIHAQGTNGCIQGNCQNGQGVFIAEGGHRYEGNFVDGKRTGKGKCLWANGDRYEGEFTDGEMTGRGSLFWKNGDRYEGEFVGGRRVGRGNFFWA